MPEKMRRMKGEGSVTQRKNGLYVVRYKSLTRTTMDRTLVPELLNDLRANYESLIERVEDPIINDALDEWLAMKATSLKSKSFDRVDQTLKNQIRPFIGKLRCSDFTDAVFTKQIMTRMIAAGLSYSSVKKAYDNMNNFCNWCILPSKKYMKHNFMLAVKKPSKTAGAWNDGGDAASNITAFLSKDQRMALISACRSRYVSSGSLRFQYGEAYILDMYTGLRLGEILALTWGDVDFSNRTVRVHSTMELIRDREPKSKTYGNMILKVFQYTKTNQPRIVPLGDMAFASINAIYSNRVLNSQYVVHNRNGGLVWPGTFSKGLVSALDLSGIELPSGTNVHALRHTFASMCFEAGMHVRVISDLLGHSSVQVTMDIYIHLVKDINLASVPELNNLS
jgi:integrase